MNSDIGSTLIFIGVMLFGGTGMVWLLFRFGKR